MKGIKLYSSPVQNAYKHSFQHLSVHNITLVCIFNNQPWSDLRYFLRPNVTWEDSHGNAFGSRGFQRKNMFPANSLFRWATQQRFMFFHHSC